MSMLWVWPLATILLRSGLAEDVPGSAPLSLALPVSAPPVLPGLVLPGSAPPESSDCNREVDKVALHRKLMIIKNYIIDAEYSKLKHLLDTWNGDNAYVENLGKKSGNYSHINCSDLQYLAKTPVTFFELGYDPIKHADTNHTKTTTVLKLALRQTRQEKERAVTGFLYETWHMGDQEEIVEQRVKIVRVLVETGFLWGSDDLVCQVVKKENGYRKEIRDAFARSILHDLVRNSFHLNDHRLRSLKDKCGGDYSDGVAWILAQAPGGFTQLSLLDPHQTVLMAAAQDDEEHDDARISFRELVQLHVVMRAPLTTVDPEGWNAEMLAALKLRRRHLETLQKILKEYWYESSRRSCRTSFVSQFLTDAMSDAYVSFCLFVVSDSTARFLCLKILPVVLFLVGVLMCCRCGLQAFWREWCLCTSYSISPLLWADICFRVLWLFMVNTVFVQFPPLFYAYYKNHVWPWTGLVPTVIFWNPLPVMTALLIVSLSCVSFLFWATWDWCAAKSAAKIDCGCAAKIGPRCAAIACQKESAEEIENSEESVAESGGCPEDRFQDPRFHFIGCACIFLLVVVLMVIYARTILQPIEMHPKRMGLWLGALLVQVKITLDEKTLNKDGDAFWAGLGYHPAAHEPEEDEQTSNKDGDDGDLKQFWADDEKGCMLPGFLHLNNLDAFNNEGSVGSNDKGATSDFCTATGNLLWHWFRWACCMEKPKNDGIWGLHMAAAQSGQKLTANQVPPVENWCWCFIWCRFMMSYISNGLFKAIIVYTLPLWLCRGSLVDFVLNAFALVYIVELVQLLDDRDKIEWTLEGDDANKSTPETESA